MITTKDKCQLCGLAVTSTNFYAFPDQRVYHCDCLVEWVLPHLPEEKKALLNHTTRSPVHSAAGKFAVVGHKERVELHARG